ncbi:uncharacterized protein UTRI_10256 [Ustilago trichophora]|uniref:Uncharacterized protein n=1 Tax=Ustilago trichophora TaxID=86804 RepID=A0A5C3EJP6_9BASI|nr:uncharacterized protein UTRI_10256 [Ustilago trichophora]
MPATMYSTVMLNAIKTLWTLTIAALCKMRNTAASSASAFFDAAASSVSAFFDAAALYLYNIWIMVHDFFDFGVHIVLNCFDFGMQNLLFTLAIALTLVGLAWSLHTRRNNLSMRNITSLATITFKLVRIALAASLLYVLKLHSLFNMHICLTVFGIAFKLAWIYKMRNKLLMRVELFPASAHYMTLRIKHGPSAFTVVAIVHSSTSALPTNGIVCLACLDLPSDKKISLMLQRQV